MPSMALVFHQRPEACGWRAFILMPFGLLNPAARDLRDQPAGEGRPVTPIERPSRSAAERTGRSGRTTSTSSFGGSSAATAFAGTPLARNAISVPDCTNIDAAGLSSPARSARRRTPRARSSMLLLAEEPVLHPASTSGTPANPRADGRPTRNVSAAHIDCAAMRTATAAIICASGVADAPIEQMTSWRFRPYLNSYPVIIGVSCPLPPPPAPPTNFARSRVI